MRPFDVVGRLCNEEALDVRLDLDVESGIDGEKAFLAVRSSRLNGYQQQLQLH